ncbi:beta strand repeat-containing protein [Pseudobdellovibrio sp. HCB154]|uniref:beta strand repeat-containing protein n=1 Tax=Pseudobdellovibrio sp. HCB154 TaxID=3386277 RepID=UPI0039172E76
MNLSVGITNFIKKFTAIALSLLLCQPTFAQSTENQQMVFEGSLTDASGNSINLSTVALTFYISANGCYLFSEWSAVAGDSQGNISHRFGNGNFSASSPNTFSQNLFFGNVNGKNIATDSPCSVTASDTRLAQVFYPVESITATIKLGTVPYAQNATMLSGKSVTDFVQVSTDTNTLFSGGAAGQYLTKSASGLTWSTNTLTSAQISSALGYTPASTTVTLTASSITNALGYTPANSATLSNYALRSNNLSDLTSATAARSNLGLGTLATKNNINLSSVDVTGPLATAHLPSFSGDVSTAAGSSTMTIQSFRGVPLAATAPVSGQVLLYNGSAWSPTTIPANIGTVTSVSSSNSDIVVTNTTTTPTLTLNVGTGPNQIVRLDSSSKLPVVDASNLQNINASMITSGTLATQRLPALSGDLSSATGSGSVTVVRLRGITVASATPTAGQVLTYNGANWTPTNSPTGSVTNVSAGTGLLGGSITSSGTLSVNFGASAGTVAAGNDSRIVGALQGVNNLSEITSATMARNNLGLGNLATKSIVTLNSADVTGVLPMANGGSKWSLGAGGIYTVSNTTIGSSTTFSNTALYVAAPISASSTVAASINNPNANGYGLKINTENANGSYYGLRVSAFDSTNFIVLNNGNVGVGVANPTARFHIAGGSSALPGLKLTSGALLASPAPGAVEFDGSNLYITDNTNTRRTLATGSVTNSLDNISTINSTSNITLSTPNSVVVSSTLASTNYQNGALIVKGGIGVNGNGNFSGGVNATGNISTSGSITTPNNIFAGAVTTPYLYGSTASGGTLAIDSTSDAGKGKIIIAGNGGNVGIGTVNPSYRFHVRSQGPNTYNSVISASSGTAMLGNGEDDYNQLYQIAYNASGLPSWFFTTGGTSYFINNVSLGNPIEIPNNKLSVHGNAHITGTATVSKTLMLNGSNTSPALQFLTTAITGTAVSNTIEYDGTSLFYTNSSAQRRRLAGGVLANTIDNVSKMTFGGNLTLEGNTASVTPAVTINNLGAGTIALQVNDSATVSGSIKLSGDGADTAVTCAAADEGKQRYNVTLKAMEFCDGTYWQGVAGVTHCTTAAGGTSFTLVGKAGTGQAYCISTNNEPATSYFAAASNCLNKATSRGSRPSLCTETQYQGACKQYTVFAAAAETKLPGFKSTAFWTPVPFTNPNYMLMSFNTATANVCDIANQGVGQDDRTSSYSYRCCYQ